LIGLKSTTLMDNHKADTNKYPLLHQVQEMLLNLDHP
jgi:hypothetical protein